MQEDGEQQPLKVRALASEEVGRSDLAFRCGHQNSECLLHQRAHPCTDPTLPPEDKDKDRVDESSENSFIMFWFSILVEQGWSAKCVIEVLIHQSQLGVWRHTIFALSDQNRSETSESLLCCP
jgi:hypothetical protein